MATNPYFTHNNPNVTEQLLLESLDIESIKTDGFDIYYLPRDDQNIDTIFEDAKTSSFNKAYPIETIMPNWDSGFDGADFISRFGLEIADAAEFIVSVKRFTEETTLEGPREGDLIYIPLSNNIMEIRFVEDQVPFYQLGMNYVWRMDCHLFRYGYEEVDIDDGTVPIEVETQIEAITELVDEDSTQQNEEFQAEAILEGIVDFTDKNPFGDY